MRISTQSARIAWPRPSGMPRSGPAPRSRFKYRPGFSLLELMVVVSILALLMSLLLPGLGKAKAQAVTVECRTHIKGFGTAMHTYLAEWEYTYPVNGLIMPKSQVPTMYATDPAINNARVFLTSEGDKFNDTERFRPEYGVLWKYMGGYATWLPGGTPINATGPTPPLPPMATNAAKIYLCRADGPGYQRDNTTTGSFFNSALVLDSGAGGVMNVTPGPGPGGYWSYSVNSVLNSLGRFRNRFAPGQLPWGDPLKFTNIRTPSNFIAFVEEDNTSLFNDEVFDAPAYSGGDTLTSRHQFGGNVGFADGHAEFFTQSVFQNGDQLALNDPTTGQTLPQVNNTQAMAYPITRMFFPDGGIFANRVVTTAPSGP